MKKLLAVLSMACLAGCYNDSREELYPTPGTGGNNGGCDTTNVSFKTTIQPILNQSCTLSGCHDALGKAAGYDLTTHAGAKASAGRLVGAVNHTSGYSPMPKGASKLDNCKIKQIEVWVNAGTPDN